MGFWGITVIHSLSGIGAQIGVIVSTSGDAAEPFGVLRILQDGWCIEPGVGCENLRIDMKESWITGRSTGIPARV